MAYQIQNVNHHQHQYQKAWLLLWEKKVKRWCLNFRKVTQRALFLWLQWYSNLSLSFHCFYNLWKKHKILEYQLPTLDEYRHIGDQLSFMYPRFANLELWNFGTTSYAFFTVGLIDLRVIFLILKKIIVNQEQKQDKKYTHYEYRHCASLLISVADRESSCYEWWNCNICCGFNLGIWGRRQWRRLQWS